MAPALLPWQAACCARWLSVAAQCSLCSIAGISSQTTHACGTHCSLRERSPFTMCAGAMAVLAAAGEPESCSAAGRAAQVHRPAPARGVRGGLQRAGAVRGGRVRVPRGLRWSHVRRRKVPRQLQRPRALPAGPQLSVLQSTPTPLHTVLLYWSDVWDSMGGGSSRESSHAHAHDGLEPHAQRRAECIAGAQPILVTAPQD